MKQQGIISGMGSGDQTERLRGSIYASIISTGTSQKLIPGMKNDKKGAKKKNSRQQNIKNFNSQSPKKVFDQVDNLEKLNFNILNSKGISTSTNLMKAIQAGLQSQAEQMQRENALAANEQKQSKIVKTHMRTGSKNSHRSKSSN